MTDIQKTTDYDKFKTLAGNRHVRKSHVNELVAAISNRNLLEDLPIIINEHFEIIDGQHRLEAARSSGIPIFYTIVEGLGIDDVQMLNSTSLKWAMDDYIKSYALKGKSDYKKILSFAEENGTTLSMAGHLLAWDISGSSHGEQYRMP